MSVVGCIPSRYGSTRLPGKALCDIAGKPMVLHVLERAHQAKSLDQVVVLTDDTRIADVVIGAGYHAEMTSRDCLSGTDRLAEYMQQTREHDIFVNIQGDELLLNPHHIDKLVAEFQQDPNAKMGTLAHKVTDQSVLQDSGTAKVVTTSEGNALYFSRQCIPLQKNGMLPPCALVHIGLYIYRRETLNTISQLAPGKLEQIEGLEQLRVIENNIDIKVVTVEGAISLSIDTPQDLLKAQQYFLEEIC